MNRKWNIRNTVLLLGGAVLWQGPAALAQGGEDEGIQQIVTEAREAAKEWASKLKEWKSGEQRSTVYMGVVIESVPAVLRDYIDLPKGVGLLLPRIMEGGPAAKAGLIDNDILVEMDGQIIVNYSQLSTLLELKGAGATVPVKVLRKGEEMTFQVQLEERVRRGLQIIPPDAPEPPEPPSPEDLGLFMERVEEWIPGSVRVFVDQDEQVHVDLQDLKDDLQGLREKIAYISVLKDDVPGIVKEHGDLGARTTMIHVADKNINYSSKEGKVSLASTGEGQRAMVWDADGKLIYEGAVPEDYKEQLPERAVRLIDALKASRAKLNLDPDGQKIEIRLNEDGIEPVTWNGR